MPMVDASTQTAPIQIPAQATTAAPQVPKQSTRPRPIDHIDKGVPEHQATKECLSAALPAPAKPGIKLAWANKTACISQPMAILGGAAGILLGIAIGLSISSLLSVGVGIAASVLALMGIMALAGAPSFHGPDNPKPSAA